MNKHQVWSLGGVESGQLLEERIEPIPQEELDREVAIQRLRNARGRPITENEVKQLIADILEILSI